MFDLRAKPTLSSWGIAGTVIYFAAVLWIIRFSGWINTGALDLNEFGDFFAGVFGPPALIWVVISFYLQSSELRHSVDALNLQAEELSKSVEQQIAMVTLTKESLTHEQKSFELEEQKRKSLLQPIFTVEFSARSKSGLKIGYKLDIRNTGSAVTQVTITVDPIFYSPVSIDNKKTWDRSDSREYSIRLVEEGYSTNKHAVKIAYTDSENSIGTQLFEIDATDDSHWRNVNCVKLG